MRLTAGILTLTMVMLQACECPPRMDEQFVSDLRPVYFADSVAEFTNPLIQFTYEVETGNVPAGANRKPCFRRELSLGIRRKTWVLADSCIITCDRDLPGTPAGKDLSDNRYVEVVKTRDRMDTTALSTISFQSWWTVPDWGQMPDTATLKFRFRLNNGLVFVKERGIRFSP